MMAYKGYTATIEFDDSVGRFHGRVVNSDPYPIATFEATDVDSLQAEFRQSVDEYLLSCQEDGIEPQNLSPENSMSGLVQNSARTSHAQRQKAD